MALPNRVVLVEVLSEMQMDGRSELVCALSRLAEKLLGHRVWRMRRQVNAKAAAQRVVVVLVKLERACEADFDVDDIANDLALEDVADCRHVAGVRQSDRRAETETLDEPQPVIRASEVLFHDGRRASEQHRDRIPFHDRIELLGGQ